MNQQHQSERGKSSQDTEQGITAKKTEKIHNIDVVAAQTKSTQDERQPLQLEDNNTLTGVSRQSKPPEIIKGYETDRNKEVRTRSAASQKRLRRKMASDVSSLSSESESEESVSRNRRRAPRIQKKHNDNDSDFSNQG